MSTAGTLYDETVKNGFARLLQSQSPTNVVNIAFISDLTDTYEVYFFDFTDVMSTADAWFYCQLSSTAGSTWSADYYYAYGNAFYNTTHALSGSRYSQNQICNTQPTTAALGGELWLYRCKSPNTLSSHTIQYGLSWSNSYGSQLMNTVGINVEEYNVVTGIRFAFSSGNIASGKFRMFGIKTGV